jgi:flagellar motility protein MotE (MotC chaperone)
MRNKLLVILSFLFFSFAIIAADEKKFTQKEIDKLVKVEVDRQINMIKKKSLTQLTKELLEKDKSLSLQSRELDVRAEQLSLSEKSLVKRIGAFEGVKTKIIGCIDGNKGSEAIRIKRLVEVISNMKPLKAAELLSTQDSTISVKLLEKIDPKKASKIFNLMDKEVSAQLQKQYLNMQQ